MKRYIFASLLMLAFAACENNEDSNSAAVMTDEEEAQIIASELSVESGGVMSDVETSYKTSEEEFYTNSKAALDTTVTLKEWLNLSLAISFYRTDGSEQSRFIPDDEDSALDDAFATDSISIKSTVSGNFESQSGPNGGGVKINLDHKFSFAAYNIVSNMLNISGTGSNNGSQYSVTVLSKTTQFDTNNSYEFTEPLLIDLTDGDYFPESGELKMAIAGKVSRLESETVTESYDYDLNYTIKFTGSKTVNVELASGKTVTIDLENGSYTIN